jgi:hypothetical protein
MSNNLQTKTNSVALRPRANYTDWSTATCRRNLVSTFVDRGVSRGQRGGSPTVVNLSFLDRQITYTVGKAPFKNKLVLIALISRLSWESSMPNQGEVTLHMISTVRTTTLAVWKRWCRILHFIEQNVSSEAVRTWGPIKEKTIKHLKQPSDMQRAPAEHYLTFNGTG